MMGEEIVGAFGINVYTLLYWKWTTNKDLLYSIGNSAHCYVVAWMQGEFGGEWTHVYVWLSALQYTWHYHNTVNLLYYNIKYKVKTREITKFSLPKVLNVFLNYACPLSEISILDR